MLTPVLPPLSRLALRPPLLGLVFFFLACSVFAAGLPPRTTRALGTWDFVPEAADIVPAELPTPPPTDAAWQTVSVPHVFRQSGLPDDAAGWYRVSFQASLAAKDHRFLLCLEGAASVKDVFVNGLYVGRHRGSFTASAFDLTPGVRTGANELLVRVSNRKAETHAMLARSTLYFVNGGMFRPAHLVETGDVHLFPEDGSTGLYLTPAKVSASSAELQVRAVVRNPRAVPVRVSIRHTVSAPDGSVAATLETERSVPAGETASLESSGSISSPRLWDLGQPNLYSVRTEVFADGKPTDALTENTGFRSLALREGRLILNGRPILLRGVNKHAQTEHEWNAIREDELRAEWSWMLDMGVNAVRLAHYPHRRFEYDIADHRGVAVWAENGYAGFEWKGFEPDDLPPTPDGERLTREMVRQLWNHPSILFWSAGNESSAATADHYADVIRETDPSRNRLVTYAVATQEPKRCDFLAYNTYEGWYSRRLADFAKNPKNAFVSETGGGDWTTHHVPYGDFRWSVDKFEPGEYAGLFAEVRLQRVFKDAPDRHPMFLWWNFREFYDRKFKQNRNTKGLVTLAGEPKDNYFLFQSFMRPDFPVVRLAGRTHLVRRFAADNGIKAYSNAPSLELFLDGTSQGSLKNGAYLTPPEPEKAKNAAPKLLPGVRVENVFFWKPSLAPGRHLVEVRAPSGARDQMVIYQAAADGTLPAAPDALVQDIASGNPANPAWYIDSPVQAQGPVYLDVDGSSDNTFDGLPPELVGATSIVTRRLSDPKLKTDLSFRIDPRSAGATVHVLLSTGSYPAITLKPRDPALADAARDLESALQKSGFTRSPRSLTWRDHQLSLADAALWTRFVPAGEKVELPGVILDYVVMLQPAR